MADVPLGATAHFDVVTNDPNTGFVSDADGPPVFSVFEEDDDSPVLSAQAMTKRGALVGNYRGSVAATAGNGFEAGRWYSVVATASVGGVAGKDVVYAFRVVAAEAAAGVPRADVSHFGGAAGSFASGRPEVNATHLGGAAYASADLSPVMKAGVNAEADAALADIHLDRLLAADYDPANKPGAATALFNELVESDGGVSRFTAGALGQAPGGDRSVLLDTTALAVTSQTALTLAAGSDRDGAYNGQTVVLYDTSSSNFPSVRRAAGYAGSTRTLTLDRAPDFTLAPGDGVRVFVTVPLAALLDGTGDRLVDHNFPTPDAMTYQVLGTGVGIDNAQVLVYLQADYDAGRTGQDYVKGRSTTDVNGRWVTPVYLNPGQFTATFWLPGSRGPTVHNFTVT